MWVMSVNTSPLSTFVYEFRDRWQHFTHCWLAWVCSAIMCRGLLMKAALELPRQRPSKLVFLIRVPQTNGQRPNEFPRPCRPGTQRVCFEPKCMRYLVSRVKSAACLRP
jgi:hypothetical protein